MLGTNTSSQSSILVNDECESLAYVSYHMVCPNLGMGHDEDALVIVGCGASSDQNLHVIGD